MKANNTINIDVIVEKGIGESIKKELEGSLRGVYGVIQKYSYIHSGDIQKTQNMIKEAFFQDNTPLLDNDEIQVNMKAIVEQVPQEIKDKMLNKILEKLASEIGAGNLDKE